MKRAITVLLVWVAACSDSPRPGPALVRCVPEVETAPEERALAERTLRPPREITPWVVDSPSYRIQREPIEGRDGRQRGLLLGGAAGQSVTVPGPLGLVNRVEVLVRARHGLQVTGRLLGAEGTQVVAAGDALVPGGTGTRRARLEFPDGFDASGGVELEFLYCPAPFTLFEIALSRVPLETRLSASGQGASWFEIGAEGRWGVPLASARPVSVPCNPGADGELVFAYGQPSAVHTDGQDLTLTLEAGGERHDFSVDAQAGWTEARLRLGSRLRGNTRLEFSLASARGGPASIALGDVRIERPVRSPATVLLITSDTHRYDHVARAGLVAGVVTPTLDGLADRGLSFEHCYSTTNVTGPSHAALFTGLHPLDTGVVTNASPLGPGPVTLAEAFARAGYRTLAVASAFHLRQELSGFARGFDRMSAPASSTWDASRTIDRALAWLAEERGQPVFLWVHLFDAHAPYLPPPDLVQPAVVPTRWDPLAIDPDLARTLYRGEVADLDRELARLLDTERVRAGVVAFTADHGENLGDHGVYWDHRGLFPQTLHVPLILAWPGGPRGQRIRTGVPHTDLGRTLLDLAGLADTPFPGLSLAARSELPERARFSIAMGRSEAAVIRGSWFLTFALREHSSNNAGEEVVIGRHALALHDLEADPGGEVDVSALQPARVAELRALLVEWLTRARDSTLPGGAIALSSDELEALAELGYTSKLEPPGEEEAETRLYDPACGCSFCLPFHDS